MYPMTQWLLGTWAANGQSNFDIRRLRSTVDGLPNHIVCIDGKLAITMTADASNDTPGEELFEVIERLRLTDVLAQDIVNIPGHMLRTGMKAATGIIPDDPADVPAGGGAGVVRYCYFKIPFHGSENGLLGMQKHQDAWLPVDRIREGTLLVDWSDTQPWDADHGTVTAATLELSFGCIPYSEIILGSDIRFRDFTHEDAQLINWPVMGQVFHTAAIINKDYDHSDYDSFTVDLYGYLSNVQREQLVMRWNEGCAHDAAQYEAPVATHGFVPVVYQDKNYSIQGTLGFPSGKMLVQTVNTNADNQELFNAEIFDGIELARRLYGRSGTVFAGTKSQKPLYSAKNRGKVFDMKSSRLDILLGRKMLG